MSHDVAPGRLLAELEARQDELLAQLEELERRIERALAEFALLKLPLSSGKSPLCESTARAA